MTTVVINLLFAALVVVCGVDVAHRRIPDRITTPMTAGALTAVIGAGWWTGRAATTAGGLAGALLFWALLGLVHVVAPAGLGRGDVKLAPSLGAAVGWQAAGPVEAAGAVLTTLVVAAVVGVAIGLVLLAKRRRNEPYPFGPALAVATVLTLLSSPA